MAKQPVEAKVAAGTTAAGIAGALVVLIISMVQGQPLDEAALAVVVSGIVTAVVTFVAGWSARHTVRTDLPPPPPPAPPAV